MIFIKFVLLHRRKASPSVTSKCIEGYIKSFFCGSTTEEPERERESERERMSNGLMELNDTELNYIYFETDSDEANDNLDEDCIKKLILF